MLDIKFIRENKEKLKKAITEKKIALDLDELLDLDKERVKLMQEVEDLSAQKNELNDKMKDENALKEDLIGTGKKIKDKIALLEPKLKEVKEKFDELMVLVPTIHAEDTPIGHDDSENVETFTWGQKPEFSFPAKTHIEIGKELNLIDLERGAKVSGYRGYYLKNEGALLAMALMNYAMEKMVVKGYAPMIPPTLVREFALFGSGYFRGREYNSDVDNIYQIASHDEEMDGSISKEKKFLVGTAEPSLLAYFSDDVLDEKDLPIKVCGYSPCYRSEIGDYGKDNKGLYRVHEFMKVEQVVVLKADIEESEKMQQEMMKITEEMYQELGLPYRQLRICTGDLSAGKYKMFDMEVWMAGLARYGETASSSSFLDWQARRLNIKYKDKDGNRKFAYLLNNTALPSVRPLIAILENYQQEDGSVVIPEVLRKWMPGGMEKIIKK